MESNAKIIAMRKGLKTCTTTVAKLESSARERARKALDRYGPESEQFEAANAEYEEIKATVQGWLYITKGREHDLNLAVGGGV
ncbi:MAG: hypothetical protein PHY12_05815 [Eubacteriales bacterium]|nr:hypothetical protein [Eubacteriales bacterium]